MNVTNQHHAFNYRGLSKGNIQGFNRESKKTEGVLKEQQFKLNEKSQYYTLDAENMPVGKIIAGTTEKNTLDKYFSFINDINTLTEEEKSMLNNAINMSVSGTVNGASDGVPLAVMQKNFELTYLNKHYIPEEYQGQMQEAIEQFTNDELTDFMEPLQKVYEGFAKILNKIGMDDSRAERIQGTVQELAQGTHHLQQSHNTYRGWFDQLANSDSFVQDYEKLLQKFEDLQVSQSNGATQNAKYNAEHIKDRLRSQWNAFSNALPNGRVPKIPTKEKSLINITV